MVEGAELGGMVGAEELVVGLLIVLVGGEVVVGSCVVVVSGGLVVATGGEVVATVPGDRVVATGGCVVPVPPEDGRVAGVVVVDSTVVDEVVELEEELDGTVTAAMVVVGRTVVTGVWVATCCLGEVSPPLATSNSRAARARKARA